MAKILIVDDDPSAGQTVLEHLSRQGHNCTLQRSGKAVLETLQNEPHDLVILDVMLPQLSGFEICRRMRRDPNLYTTPILIMSAMSNEEEIVHGLSQGADDFVSKPFDTANFMQRVESLLRTSSSGSGIDELTGLPGGEATKRELQRRISMREKFSVSHCELLNLREFGRKYGNEGRNKAVRHLGRALSQCSKELTKDVGYVGHMGGGHFMVMMPAKHMRAYCPWVRKVWAAHVGKLYAEITGSEKPQAIAAGKERALDVLFCVANCENIGSTAPQHLFELLSHLRTMALNSKEGGVFTDRRGTAG
ncbi:MAG TPA: response regulator [Candidatus Hydrogenedentes bacterium]|nr:response regulator [Candidatus Hydrogenedentota bacterium]HRK36185.1 response regulator [Candidatus Hydrogenedentota bacterium]